MRQYGLTNFDRGTEYYSKDGRKVSEFDIVTLSPIKENDTVRLVCNSYKIQNAGNTVIEINGGWTLNPGGTENVGDGQSLHVIVHDLRIKFLNENVLPGDCKPDGTPSDPRNRLEIRLMVCHSPLVSGADRYKTEGLNHERRERRLR